MRIFSNPNYNFVKWRWHAIVLSLAIIGAGIFTIVSRGGLPLGVDFTGGTVLILKFEKPTTEEAVRTALSPLSGEAVVQRFGAADSNEMMARLPLINATEQGNNLEQDSARAESVLKAANIGAFTVIGRELVGPSIGKDLQSKGIWATITALGGILVYIGLRFRFSFAVGAVVATLHDIMVTLTFLVWFGYDVSLNIVAAILTIAGYSVNDTIVVFDRVRENQRTARREPLEILVNQAVNQTLGRTIITAGTTFLSVLALYLFGGEVLNGFAFTMLVGIIAGTYSTVFIAAAIAIFLSKKPPTQAAAKTAAEVRPRRAKVGA
jgi:preprotein translocase subunit SecF